MFGSVILEVALGLILVYTVLGFICVHINEWLAAIFRLRAKNLAAGLLSMLDDPDLVQSLYYHPLIFGLWKSKARPAAKGQDIDAALRETAVTGPPAPEPAVAMDRPPSYIPSTYLAQAIIDRLRVAQKTGEAAAETIESLRANLGAMTDGQLKNVLTVLLQKTDTVKDLRHELECWFDHAMDRIAGTYKRKMHKYSLWIAVSLTCFFNIDTIQIFKALYYSTTLRLSVAALATNTAAAGDADLQTWISLFKSSGLTIGWDPALVSTDSYWLICKLAGLGLTVAAISMGAPFWFGLLNRAVNIRLAGKVPDKSCKEETVNLKRLAPAAPLRAHRFGPPPGQ